ncbi:MAG: hypothetical protein K2Y31_16790 [Burkholderiales bacterium]|jgi:hypothetical protein|nr:hypothetical protein [Burkholderiales bacterium]
MMNATFRDAFLSAADGWVCDGYSIDIRYLAEKGGGQFSLWGASVFLNPLPPKEDLGFSIDLDRMVAGQVQKIVSKKSELMKVLSNAAAGVV